MALTKAQLEAMIAANLPDNITQLITPALHREVLEELLDAVYPTAIDLTGDTIPAYNPLTQYQPGPDVYVIYDDVIWRFVAASPTAGITPGTDETVWVEINVNELAHPQNTDYRLGENIEFLSSIPNPLGLYDYPGKNFFLLAADSNSDLYIESTKTETVGVDTVYLQDNPYEFYIAVAAGDTGTYNIKQSDQMETPTGADVVLVAMDWVKCKLVRDASVSAVNRPIGRIQIIAAKEGVTGAGGAGTGHDQNTDVGTDKDTWNIGAAGTAGTDRTLTVLGSETDIDLALEPKGAGVLKSSVLATGIGPIEVDASGEFSKKEAEELSDSPLSSIILVAPDTGQWRVTVDNSGNLTTTAVV